MSDEKNLAVAVTAPVQDVALTAENADEMAQCQGALISWCKAKVAEVRHQADELKEAFEHALKRKWKSETLKRHAGLAMKRLDFYERMLTALEHGYQIVPSFPITAFAIRTDRKKPLHMWTTSYSKSHEQDSWPLAAGKGEYKNPFPVVLQDTQEPATVTKSEVCAYWASAWKDLEFPLSMSKPRIMQAVDRAMALKIFDDIGILPGYAPSEGTRPPKGDPLIIARLKDPRPRSSWQKPRYLSFIIAWHLDTSDLV